MKLACRKCHAVTDKEVCPVCNNKDFTDDWGGLLIVFDSENSKLGEHMGITKSGEYAVKVR